MQVPARRIYTDGRDWPADEPPTLGGYSIGNVIDQTATDAMTCLKSNAQFYGTRVFESTGFALHEDNATIVRKKIYLDRNNSDILHDESRPSTML